MQNKILGQASEVSFLLYQESTKTGSQHPIFTATVLSSDSGLSGAATRVYAGVLTFERRGDEAFPTTTKTKAKPKRKAKAAKVSAASSTNAAHDGDDDGAEDDGDNDGDDDVTSSVSSSSSSSSSSGSSIAADRATGNSDATGSSSAAGIDSAGGGGSDKADANTSGKVPLALLIARQLKRTDVRCERAPSIAWPVYQARCESRMARGNHFLKNLSPKSLHTRNLSGSSFQRYVLPCTTKIAANAVQISQPPGLCDACLLALPM